MDQNIYIVMVEQRGTLIEDTRWVTDLGGAVIRKKALESQGKVVRIAQLLPKDIN